MDRKEKILLSKEQKKSRDNLLADEIHSAFKPFSRLLAAMLLDMRGCRKDIGSIQQEISRLKTDETVFQQLQEKLNAF